MKTLLTILFMMVSISVFANDRHDDHSTPVAGPKGDTGAQGPIGNTGPQGPRGFAGKDAESIVNNYSVTNNYRDKGLATSMALSGQQYDWSSEAMQWSVSGSSFDSREGAAIGLAQRFGAVLVNVNIAQEENSNTPAYVVGVSGRF